MEKLSIKKDWKTYLHKKVENLSAKKGGKSIYKKGWKTYLQSPYVKKNLQTPHNGKSFVKMYMCKKQNIFAKKVFLKNHRDIIYNKNRYKFCTSKTF